MEDYQHDFELIFNMLGERATTEIHRQEKSVVPSAELAVKLRPAGGFVAHFAP